jgi:histidinol-phosphate phosphatase family protein
VRVAGLPLIDHLLGWLASEDVREVVICAGHRAGEVLEAAGDGRRFGLRVRQSVEARPLGTAGAIRQALPLLAERFFVVYADVLASVDLAALARAHLASGASATAVVHPNDHPADSDRCVVDASGWVVRIARRSAVEGPEAGASCNAALCIFERRALDAIGASEGPADVVDHLFPALAASRKLFAFRTAEYLRDVGTPARLEAAEREIRAGIPAAMRRSARRPAVLLDRDGVLIEDVPHLHDVKQLQIVPGAATAVARLNRRRILAACLTNQPQVARGELSLDGLKRIHDTIEGLLGAEGAWLDAIHACPHHPDRGFAGEVPELKVSCGCRKPLPGLIDAADAALGIDRGASILVGDRTADLAAARAGGILGIGVLTGAACKDGLHPLRPETPLVANLSAAVSLLCDTAPSWEKYADQIEAAGVVLIGGPSRSGKTTAAAALQSCLQSRATRVVRLSLDRFIQPAGERAAGAGVYERTGFAAAAAAVASLASGEPALVPGYDPFTRGRSAAELSQWPRQGVLIVEGILACAVKIEGALCIALHGEPDELRERRRSFYRWKGLSEDDALRAVEGRAEEHQLAADLASRAALQLRVRRDGTMGPAR